MIDLKMDPSVEMKSLDAVQSVPRTALEKAVQNDPTDTEETGEKSALGFVLHQSKLCLLIIEWVIVLK